MGLLKDIHDLVNFLAGKNISTKQPPERVDLAVYNAILEVFKENYENYVKTQKISDYLLPYKRTFSIDLTNGTGVLPGDYMHHRGLRTTEGKKIDLVEDKFWDGRLNSKVSPPSTTNIIARIEVPEGIPSARKIYVIPTDQTKAILEYFIAPVKPRYGYTVSGNRYIYNANTTIEVDFSALLLPEIQKRVLSQFGINLRDRDLTIYAEQQKREELVR